MGIFLTLQIAHSSLNAESSSYVASGSAPLSKLRALLNLIYPLIRFTVAPARAYLLIIMMNVNILIIYKKWSNQ